MWICWETFDDVELGRLYFRNLAFRECSVSRSSVKFLTLPSVGLSLAVD